MKTEIKITINGNNHFINRDLVIEQIISLTCLSVLSRSLQQFVTWRKATFDFKDDQGNNVMHLIAQGGHLDTAIAMINEENVDYRARYVSNFLYTSHTDRTDTASTSDQAENYVTPIFVFFSMKE